MKNEQQEPPTPPTHLFMLPPADWRKEPCGVCGKTTLLKFRCTSTGLLVGQCCIVSMLTCEKFLLRVKEVRPPTMEESQKFNAA